MNLSKYSEEYNRESTIVIYRRYNHLILKAKERKTVCISEMLKLTDDLKYSNIVSDLDKQSNKLTNRLNIKFV